MTTTAKNLRRPAVAIVSVRAVFVDCPNCEASMHEPATPADNVPWGKVEDCWSCGAPVKLPRSPFA